MAIELAESTTYLAQKVALKAMAALEGALIDLDLTARHFIVLVLASSADQPAQVEIAAKLGVDATVLGRMLDELEERGLLARQRASRDRRRHELVLTSAGRALLAKADQRRRTAEESFFSRLGDDRHAFHDLLRQLL